MSKRISLKLTDKNDWLVDKLNEEKERQNRLSFNNMVETILVEYFEERVQKIGYFIKNILFFLASYHIFYYLYRKLIY